MVGIPDGLGAFAHGDHMVVYMNHEYRRRRRVHAHGLKGSFVSRNVVDPDTGRCSRPAT